MLCQSLLASERLLTLFHISKFFIIFVGMQKVAYRGPMGETIRFQATEDQTDRLVNVLCFSIGFIAVGAGVLLLAKAVKTIRD
jgi:hypothetical protein